MTHYEEIVKFEKNGLTVIVDKTDETIPLDMTLDESVYDLNDIAEKIKNYTYEYFILRVRVMYKDYELESNTIGGCLYEDAKEVLTDGTADSLIEQTFKDAQERLKELALSLQELTQFN